MKDILQDSILDTIKLIPFLFITYLIMEYIEHKTSDKLKEKIQKSTKFGPLFGALVGILPQCGFSASATNLYVARLISIGTLIAVYLSTSDEMLPILISEAVPISTVIKVLALKFVIGVFFGFIIDFIYNKLKKNRKGVEEEQKIVDLCESEHCNCKQKGIIRATLKHTINITVYIFIITVIINLLVNLIGEETIEQFIQNNLYLGPIIASLIGLIPNCVASVIITNLYIQNVINLASLISGLLTGAGVGLIILFKTNKQNIKENISIALIIYIIGVISGWIIQFIGLTL